MRHIKLYEQFCEGDMEDMLSYIRSVTTDFKQLHYGFDYIEIRLTADSYEKKEAQQDLIVDILLKKFEKQILEIYTEETGWFKIYLDDKGNVDRTNRSASN